MRFYKITCTGKFYIKRKVSVLFAARPRTVGTRPAGRHRPFTCIRWRSKDCNLKRAAPSDVWGNLCIIVTTRKVMAGKSRWLMGFPLDRCGIAPAIAAILAPTISRSLSVERTDRAEYSIFKVQKVLFTIHAKYEIFCVGFTQNFGFFYESTTLLPKAFPLAEFLERKIQDSFFSGAEHGFVEVPLQRR